MAAKKSAAAASAEAESGGSPQYLIRMLFIGDAAVGKTSLITRFNDGEFLEHQKTTIGVDYKAKEFTIDGHNAKLQIWDTAGQERFRAMTSAFYNKAQGVAVTFDVTQRSSFNNLSSWISDARRSAPSTCLFIVLANKVDLPEERWQVRREEISAFVEENKLSFYECSAVTGQGVTEALSSLAAAILHENRSILPVVQVEDAAGRNGYSQLLANYTDKQRAEQKKGCC